MVAEAIDSFTAEVAEGACQSVSHDKELATEVELQCCGLDVIKAQTLDYDVLMCHCKEKDLKGKGTDATGSVSSVLGHSSAVEPIQNWRQIEPRPAPGFVSAR